MPPIGRCSWPRGLLPPSAPRSQRFGSPCCGRRAPPIVRRSRSLANIGLTAADRARLARELGRAYEQVDRLPEAVRFFTLALEGQTAAARAPIRLRITSLNEE